MKPNKIMWLLGYKNLALVLEQERKHWLMKTDKNLEVQDKRTGDIFKGKIDNIGTDVLIESKKLPYKYDFVPEMVFKINDGVNPSQVFDVKKSAFPHSEEVNGLMMGVIKSINLMIEGSSEYRTYKLAFTDAEEVVIPFGIGTDIEGVIATRWIKTSTPPVLKIYDSHSSSYSITRDLEFVSTVTDVVWYYPLDANIKPFNITQIGTTYETDAIDDVSCIGYPLFWFTSANSAVGTNVTYTGDTNKALYIGNDGNIEPFNGYVFTGLTDNCSPDGDISSNVTITVTSRDHDAFNNNDNDFNVPLSNVIKFNNSDITIDFDPEGSNVLKMFNELAWEYVDANTYQIPMDIFDVNNINNADPSVLLPMLTVSFDTSTPFVKITTDEGMSGIKASASAADENRYPYGLNNIDGLPEWMNDINSEGISPECLIAYAYHVPAGYNGDPNDLQGAGLIVDPGLLPGTDVSDNDTKGRVYVLSNDPIEYENNSNAEYPKPARTAARICDIPTTIFDFDEATIDSNIPIVDKKYTRTECSYTEEDKSKLYNDMQSRWVRPTACNINGIPICEIDPETFSGKFAFDGESLLNQVDMYHENNSQFRETVNLNPMVEIFSEREENNETIHIPNVAIAAVVNGGSGYNLGDEGACIVGGFPFTYKVTNVSSGVVYGCDLIFDYTVTEIPSINISNFDNLDYTTGFTSAYGTSPYDPLTSGTGMKVILKVDPGYLSTIIPSKGEFFKDLFALVRRNDGLFAYRYMIDETSMATPKPGRWVPDSKLSDYETSSSKIEDGGLSTRDAYLNSIIPSVRMLPVSEGLNDKEETQIKVTQTATMLNVIDTSKSLIWDSDSNKTAVDINKMHGMWHTGKVNSHSATLIMSYLKNIGAVHFDCYIIWKWSSKDAAEKNFIYAVLHRGLNNFMSSDVNTLLPNMDLEYNKYVHVNGNTTLIWNHPLIGPMTWVYDPNYKIKETYILDAETKDLSVVRNKLTYADIDIYKPQSITADTNIVNTDNGYLDCYVLTTNPISARFNPDDPVDPFDPDEHLKIYHQPELTQIAYGNGSSGDNINNFKDDNDYKNMFGNWRLVFPRVNSVKFMNDAANTVYNPMRMQILKGNDIPVGSSNRITDENGNDITTKNVVITQVTDPDTGIVKLRMVAFNPKTGKWEIV